MNPIAILGSNTLKVTAEAGRLAMFVALVWQQMFKYPLYFRVILKQCELIGFHSLPIVLLTSFFTGGVLALQTYNGFDNSTVASSQLGSVVALSILRELGPVLGSLMVAGRVGAAIAAEIGTMKVTEQVDALVTLATNPVKYLIVPRVMACMVMLPLLVIVANIVGISGGYVVATSVLGLNPHTYMDNSFAFVQLDDITLGIVKATVFGFIIGLMGCYHGYNTRGGAEGVGHATTVAVVYASVGILVSDYFITAWFL
jgi:phospholipid/cholesterol/gamma-HCH transport system permease protein